MSKLDEICNAYTNTETHEEDEEFNMAVKTLFLKLIESSTTARSKNIKKSVLLQKVRAL
jgi:hypothetical protein